MVDKRDLFEFASLFLNFAHFIGTDVMVWPKYCSRNLNGRDRLASLLRVRTGLIRTAVTAGLVTCSSLLASSLVGCNSVPKLKTSEKSEWTKRQSHSRKDTQALATLASVRLQKPNTCNAPEISDDVVGSRSPHTTQSANVEEVWDLTLAEAIQTGLASSTILRDLGGQIVESPETVPDRFQVALTSSDPRFGVQAALSAFDAQLLSRITYGKNDRVFNNAIRGLGAREFQQDLFGIETGISKRTATGASFSLSHRTDYDANNATANLFPSAWNTQLNATARVPLLRGAGAQFNRIAGPDAQPGFFLAQGVLLARVNEDISAADFEQGVTNYLNDLETSYWELYYAYRNLDIIGSTRESVTELVRQSTESVKAGTEDGFRQLAAEIQLTALDGQYQDALGGNANGSDSVGVYRGERKLRWLMGLPPTDHRLIRPSDTPTEASMAFDWESVANEASSTRVELRRQLWKIKKRELELIAAKNFILPQLDVFTTYRIRGFGDDLTGNTRGRFSDAWRNFGTMDYQELEGGVEFSMPVGFRQGWAAVRHARLSLAREQAVLKNQTQRIVSDLSDAVAEMDRASMATKINYRRLLTALAYQDSVELAWENRGQVTVESRLDAINQVAFANTQFHRSVVDQALAVKQVHVAKGSLLRANGVILSESSWPSAALYQKNSAAGDLKYNAHGSSKTCPASIGGAVVDQQVQYEINAELADGMIAE